MVDARRKRTDPVLPLVRRSERAARPADERGRESTQSREQIGPQHTASAHIGAHQRHEVEERRAASGGANLDCRVAIGARAREHERHFLPRRSARRQWKIRQHASVFRKHAQRQSRHARLDLDPDRSVIGAAGLEKDALLSDSRRLTSGGQPHALRATLERRLHHARRVRRSEGGPVRLEVLALEAGTADLLGEEAVDDGVIDVFEELAVNLPVDSAKVPVGVDLKDGDAGRRRRDRCVPRRIEETGRQPGEREQRGSGDDLDARRHHALPLAILLQVVAEQRQRGTAPGAIEAAQSIAPAQPQRLSEQRMHGRALEPAVLPR